MSARDYLLLESGVFGYGAMAAQCARALGFRPVLLARDPQEYAGALIDPRPHVDEVIAVDTFDVAKLLRISLERRPAGVLGFDDFRQLPAAVLARFAGTGDPGLAQGLVNTRFKDRTRQVLADTEFALPFSVHDLDRDPPRASAVGYPCVVKPVDEAGSTGVRICADEAEFGEAVRALGEALGAANARGYRSSRGILVEAVIPGPEYSAEVAYDPSEGRWRLAGATRKLVTPPPFCVEAGHVFPAPFDPPTAAAVESALDRMLQHLGLRNTVAHVEFKLDGERVRLIEVNPRPGGDMIVELVKCALGIDLMDAIVRLHAGLPLGDLLTPTRRRVAGVRFLFPPRPGIVTDLRVPRDPVAGEVRRRLPVLPRTVRAVSSSAERMGFVVAVADDEAGLEDALERYVAGCEFVYQD
jgi:hypothetical protein